MFFAPNPKGSGRPPLWSRRWYWNWQGHRRVVKVCVAGIMIIVTDRMSAEAQLLGRQTVLHQWIVCLCLPPGVSGSYFVSDNPRNRYFVLTNDVVSTIIIVVFSKRCHAVAHFNIGELGLRLWRLRGSLARADLHRLEGRI